MRSCGSTSNRRDASSVQMISFLDAFLVLNSDHGSTVPITSGIRHVLAFSLTVDAGGFAKVERGDR